MLKLRGRAERRRRRDEERLHADVREFRLPGDIRDNVRSGLDEQIAGVRRDGRGYTRRRNGGRDGRDVVVDSPPEKRNTNIRESQLKHSSIKQRIEPRQQILWSRSLRRERGLPTHAHGGMPARGGWGKV